MCARSTTKLIGSTIPLASLDYFSGEVQKTVSREFVRDYSVASHSGFPDKNWTKFQRKIRKIGVYPDRYIKGRV